MQKYLLKAPTVETPQFPYSSPLC